MRCLNCLAFLCALVMTLASLAPAAPAPKTPAPPTPPKDASLNKGKVEGTEWTSRPRSVQGFNLPAGSLVITFGDDKTLTYGGNAVPVTFKYELMPGHEIKLLADNNNASGNSIKVVVDGDKLTLSLLDGTIPVEFDRIKSDGLAPKAK